MFAGAEATAHPSSSPKGGRPCRQLNLEVCLLAHRPTINNWDAVGAPLTVCRGRDDTAAAPLDALLERLPHATAIELDGDHLNAVADPKFTDAIVDLVA